MTGMVTSGFEYSHIRGDAEGWGAGLAYGLGAGEAAVSLKSGPCRPVTE